MALGRQGERQGEVVVTWKEMPRSPGHIFSDRLQGGADRRRLRRFAETTCKLYYAAMMGAPSFRTVGTFGCNGRLLEKIEVSRAIEWHRADSLSLRDFLRL